MSKALAKIMVVTAGLMALSMGSSLAASDGTTIAYYSSPSPDGTGTVYCDNVHFNVKILTDKTTKLGLYTLALNQVPFYPRTWDIIVGENGSISGADTSNITVNHVFGGIPKATENSTVTDNWSFTLTGTV